MHLRSLIQGAKAPGVSPTPAKVAIPAIVGTSPDCTAGTIATFATFAAPAGPESWPDLLRSLPPVEGVNWEVAADVLDSLIRAATIDKALGLGWAARELIGVCRSLP